MFYFSYLDRLFSSLPASQLVLIYTGITIFMTGWLIVVKLRPKDNIGGLHSIAITLAAILSMALMFYFEGVNPSSTLQEVFKPKREIHYHFISSINNNK